MFINKTKLVIEYYCQEECINYDEIFAPIVRLESIKIFLDYAAHNNFKIFQLNI